MTFGEKLQEARKRAGYSQEQLAEKLSVSRSAVAKWENDNGMPDIANLKAMS
ncbi:MAG: helix-turn-helix transcriptional regulator [Firmicutes bacterium]|nr:helix-turn-helix transcriptional regulator [Bacillota bacterium]